MNQEVLLDSNSNSSNFIINWHETVTKQRLYFGYCDFDEHIPNLESLMGIWVIKVTKNISRLFLLLACYYQIRDSDITYTRQVGSVP